jgi:hypothetical protein
MPGKPPRDAGGAPDALPPARCHKAAMLAITRPKG